MDNITLEIDDRNTYFPVRILISFQDEEALDVQELNYQGFLLTERVDAYLTKKYGEAARLTWHHTKFGSLDNFNLLKLDVAEVLSESVTEYAAAKWILNQIGEFLDSEEEHSNISSYTIGAGSPIYSSYRPDLEKTDERFDWQRMVALRSRKRSLATSNSETAPSKPTRVTRSYSKRLATIAGLIVFGFLVAWNVAQSISTQQRDARVEDSVNRITELLEQSPSTATLQSSVEQPPPSTVTIQLVLNGEMPQSASNANQAKWTEHNIGGTKLIIFADEDE